ncbi:MAG: hypothetical protein M1831_004719 [Alyxoria varia]|nr:MAG: hypothetical protein M1831_004719 [Alyxoria varia]
MSAVLQQAMSWVQAIPNASSQSPSDPSSGAHRKAQSQDTGTAFQRLPDHVLDLILVYADPETFASLAVLNRQWRSKASSSLFYAFHLAKIDSEKGKGPYYEDLKDENFGKLKSLLARQVTSNLMAAYRPRQHRYKLVCPSSLSSTAVPHGEAFSFSASPSNSRIVIFSSTLMCIFKPTSRSIELERSFKIPRRPTAVAINDEGRALAILSPEWSLNVYSLGDGPAERRSSFVLEEAGKAIALSPDSGVIVVSEKHGLEILSLAHDSSQSPRRKIATHEFDHVCFTDAGTTIIGSSVKSTTNCTTVVTVEEPITEAMGEDISQQKLAHLWTTQPLFPSTFSQTTHAIPVPGDVERLVAYDTQAKTFGILNTHEVRFSQPLVPAPMDEASFATMLPTIDPVNGVLAVAFREAGLYLARLPRHEGKQAEQDFELDVQHQLFSRPFNALKWIAQEEDCPTSTSRSLLALRSSTSEPDEESESEKSTDSAEIVVLEYAYHASVEPSLESTIDLSSVPSESLEQADSPTLDQVEETRHLLTAQSKRRPKNPPVARSVTSAGRRKLKRKNSSRTGQTGPQVEPLAPEEVHLDDPYTPSEPRSRATLQRAATAGARRPRTTPRGNSVIRGSDGRQEIPDESDADNWVFPPPQYSKDADKDLPEGLQRTLLPAQRMDTPEFTNSSPNLLLNSDDPGNSTPQQPEPPLSVPRQRPRTGSRPMTAIQNARHSMVGGVQDIRRAFGGPLETAKAGEEEVAQERYSSAPTASRSQTMTADWSRVSTWGLNRTAAQNPRPLSSHIDSSHGSRSFPGRSRLKRPQSMFSSSTGPQPLDTSKTSSVPPHSVESPALPSPSQVERLHRRHHSGSISSARSDSGDVIPRSAFGARRQASGPSAPQSPWSSQLMLTSVAEAEPGAASGAGGGTFAASNGDATHPRLRNETNEQDTVSGAQEPLPPSSDEDSKENNAVQFDNGKENTDSDSRATRRLSRHLHSRRLSTIQSMTSLMSSARSAIGGSEGGESSKRHKSDSRGRNEDGIASSSNNREGTSGSGVQRSQSRKLQRGNSGKVQPSNSKRLQRGNGKVQRGNSKLQREPSTRVQKPANGGVRDARADQSNQLSTKAKKPVGKSLKDFRTKVKVALMNNLRTA